MAIKPMKRDSRSLIITEIKINTTVTMTSHLLERPLSELTSGDVERLAPLGTVGANVKWCRNCGIQYGGFSKS